MYKKILAAVNEHTNSEIAARYAVSLAGACHARLTLFFAAGAQLDKDALRKAESAVGRLFSLAQESGIDVESVVSAGDPVSKITEHVLEHGVDIVFAGSRHEDAHKRFFARTVARELMLHLPCATAVVRVTKMGRVAPSGILLPLRGGLSFSEERAYFAAKLAEGFGARVTLFHLPAPVTKFFQGEVHLSPAEREKRVPPDVMELARYLGGLGIPCDISTARGRTGSSITAEAAFKKSGLIIMGESRRDILTSFVKGNPVEELMKSPPCNLIIFRPRRAS